MQCTFPDASVLEPLNNNQKLDVEAGIQVLIVDAAYNGVSDDNLDELRQIFTTHTDVFRTWYLAGPPAMFVPLKIDLVANAKPVYVRSRNYSQDQREFLATFKSLVEATGMA